MYKPQEGRVLLDGIDLAQLSKPVLAQHLGYLQQEGRLFAGTLRENLLLGQVDPGDEAILEAARRTGLAQAVIATHSRGLQQPIFEGGTGLSGGQRQLVNLTRLLLRRPRLWLLDEPTAALDGNTERQVIEMLRRELRPEDTLVLVTHKPELLQLVSRLIVIAEHRIVADGPTAQVLARLQAPAATAQPHLQKVAA
jgi:ATP-binding cassette subfamily C protein LapB